jgi:hypothetical protein
MELSKQGIPYSLAEAEAAVKAHGHLMDEYHKSLMEWLIAEVRRLRGPREGANAG